MHGIIYLLYLEFLATQRLGLQFIKRPVSAIRWYDYTTAGQFNIGHEHRQTVFGDIKKTEMCSLKQKPFATISCKGLSHSSVPPANCHGTLYFQYLSVGWLIGNGEDTYGMWLLGRRHHSSQRMCYL
jgi:hypothetical protein